MSPKSVLPNTLPTIALVGNPNCGKTTLFNALTGTWQQVGNWAGVTVERKCGFFEMDGQSVEVVDLPGTYTLTTIDPHGPQDENVTSEFLKTHPNYIILNIIDALNIERNLYLTLQCLEQNSIEHPSRVIIALNRIDLAQKNGEKICIETLSQHLGCKVISLVARQLAEVEALKIELKKSVSQAPFILNYPSAIETQLQCLEVFYKEITQGKSVPRYQLLRWLEGEAIPCNPSLTAKITMAQQVIETQTGYGADVMIAQTRYAFIEEIVAKAKHKTKASHAAQHQTQTQTMTITQKIDKIVCHRYLGLPIFLAMMYALFFFAINIGGAFQDFFELSSRAIFVEGLMQVLAPLQLSPWLMALCVSGIGEGISTVLTFIPVIGAMFFALAFFEDSGYMARAAFVVDRLMCAIGLPGKSFVPMIIGFGCNVPAIMGARTLDNKRDRILAVMMSPFMSCGARLAIFTVFVSAFFLDRGQNIVFLLYLIGIMMAVVTGLLLKKTVLQGEISPLLMEMPDYQWPHWRSLWLHSWHRLQRFVTNAGKLIVPVCMCIGILNSVSTEGKWLHTPDSSSLLSVVGQKIVPLFKPLGIEEDNWPAAVGLFTGILAKEVVIGTLNALYTQPLAAIENLESEAKDFDLGEKCMEALKTVPQNLAALVIQEETPVEMGHHAFGEMVKRFHSQENAFAYLLFVLLYFPCVSATAAMVREVQRGWTLFSICWTSGLAYMIAVVYYQCATFSAHPVQTIAWLVIALGLGVSVYFGGRVYGRKYLPRIVPTPILLVQT